jgi:fused signal recognition particle receptor
LIKKEDWIIKLKTLLKPTQKALSGRISNIISKKVEKNEVLEEIEEILIAADVGVNTSNKIITLVKDKKREPKELKRAIKEEIEQILRKNNPSLNLPNTSPAIIMMVGANGVGKTTTIAKLANKFKSDGKRVLLSAADTYRAAGIAQLEVWAERLQVELIKQKEGADPGAVVYDSILASKARGIEILIIDTAGRFHTKVGLVNELKKIKKVCSRLVEEAPHEILLVLDANTGQNAISQARVFCSELGVTGVVLVKLDGTAKGGVVVAIADELKIPIKLVGFGEGVEDLNFFDGSIFANALLEG